MAKLFVYIFQVIVALPVTLVVYFFADKYLTDTIQKIVKALLLSLAIAPAIYTVNDDGVVALAIYVGIKSGEYINSLASVFIVFISILVYRNLKQV